MQDREDNDWIKVEQIINKSVTFGKLHLRLYSYLLELRYFAYVLQVISVSGVRVITTQKRVQTAARVPTPYLAQGLVCR